MRRSWVKAKENSTAERLSAPRKMTKSAVGESHPNVLHPITRKPRVMGTPVAQTATFRMGHPAGSGVVKSPQYPHHQIGTGFLACFGTHFANFPDTSYRN